MTQASWTPWKRRQKPKLAQIEDEPPLLLAPEEIRSGAIFTCVFTDDRTPIYMIEANTVRGLRMFSNILEFVDFQASPIVAFSFPTRTVWSSDWGTTVTGSATTGGAAFAPSEPEEAEASAAEVLATLETAGVPAANRRRMILAAEVLRFDAAQAESLKPLLRRYIDRQYGSDQGDEQIAVASAVRKYIALLSVAELPTVTALLQADRKAPPPFEMEVAKMITRKLLATLPDDTAPLQSLGEELMDLVAGYATPRMLPKRYCGAVALDAMLSLALLRSRHLPGLTSRLRSIPINWFRATVARQARVLRGDIAKRFSAERCRPASQCLADLAAAAEPAQR